MYNINMKSVNDTADNKTRLCRGIYLMTDIFGNQRKVKVSPAEKSVKIELIENAPKLKTCKEYDECIYKDGCYKLKFDGVSPLYIWNDKEFKVYTESGSVPLYFEFQGRI